MTLLDKPKSNMFCNSIPAVKPAVTKIKKVVGGQNFIFDRSILKGRHLFSNNPN